MSDALKSVTPDDIWAAVLALVLIGSAVLVVVKWLHPVVAKVTRVLDLFLGRPEEQGIPAIPGVIERLDAQDERLRKIEKEVTPNSGTSAHDKITRRIGNLDAKVDALFAHLSIEPPVGESDPEEDHAH